MPQENWMDLESFIKEYFPEYKIDNDNRDVIHNLSLWACRSEKFNNAKKSYHLDKGILLMGPVGTGKTDLFYILNIYIGNYLGSSYRFNSAVAWKYAAEFSKNGYAAFDNIQRGNIYFDELCLTDENTNFPAREATKFYGNELLIGRELIMTRYDVITNHGWQTHFSTNVDLPSLKKIYGDRVYSRLLGMCNIMLLAGQDRRGKYPLHIYNNKNVIAPPKEKIFTRDSTEEGKAAVEQYYKDYLEGRNSEGSLALIYLTAVGLGVQPVSEDRMRILMQQSEDAYVEDARDVRKGNSERESIKKSRVWEGARQAAMLEFFSVMKLSNAKSVFGERNVVQDLNKSADQIGK